MIIHYIIVHQISDRYIPKPAWDNTLRSQEQRSIPKGLSTNDLSNIEPMGIIQASTNFSEDRKEEKGGLDHYIGVATTKECPDDLAQLDVPATTWAVFESIGPFPDTLQNIWGRIYSEWFPTSDYESAPGPEILWNEQKDTTSPTFRSEIWIPVKKK